MTIKTQVNEILNKKMDRQDFIKHIAIGVIATTGAGAALRLLSPKQKTVSVSGSSGGYGGSAYGGSKDGGLS